VGVHERGLVGGNLVGAPDNLMSYLSQVAAGIRPCLNTYGNVYPTPDGTGVRDHIHVVDLARGHLATLQYLESDQRNITVNLRAGCGTNVMDMVEMFSRVTGQAVPFCVSPRRAGEWQAALQTPDWLSPHRGGPPDSGLNAYAWVPGDGSPLAPGLLNRLCGLRSDRLQQKKHLPASQVPFEN
jgi:UDP-glucose 4-epimerase